MLISASVSSTIKEPFDFGNLRQYSKGNRIGLQLGCMGKKRRARAEEVEERWGGAAPAPGESFQGAPLLKTKDWLHCDPHEEAEGEAPELQCSAPMPLQC